jgi:hypothetical protein
MLGPGVVHLPLFINPEPAEVSIPAGVPDQISCIITNLLVNRTPNFTVDRDLDAG